jgi:predicted ribosome quality control (RQC) complex YloA/Tae2 family protein
MPLDGVTLAGVAGELSSTLLGGRVEKIAQPETDEIILNIRAKGTYKLLLTANANAPRVHLTETNKPNPTQAPMFCMVLRKHLSGGRVVAITQPDFERILALRIESLNEMGDRSVKTLLIEIMGKHSNIILLDEQDVILDSARHISHDISTVREVLPGRLYARPPAGDKVNPAVTDAETFENILLRDDKKQLKIQQAIYQSFNGISPVTASEICVRAGTGPEEYTGALTTKTRERLYETFHKVFTDVTRGTINCQVYLNEQGRPADFSVMPYKMFAHRETEGFASPSAMLEAFYRKRDADYRLSQKTADLRKLVDGYTARCVKKQLVHEQTLEEIKDRDLNRVYGELLTAYIYKIEKGADVFAAENFFEDGAETSIPLDPALTPAENAQAYFKQYNKQKRTHAALQEQMAQNAADIAYLDTVSASLQTAVLESDIADIRAELFEQGFLKKNRVAAGGKTLRKGKHPANKTARVTSKPLHFISSDGFDMYVGKNNTQNDTLTLRFAQNGDIWLHTKDIAGSHVIIRTNNVTPPDATLHEAVNLAAYYSKGRESAQVPVDYVIKKHVRKPNGAKPGFVIYDHHKTAYVTPEEPTLKTTAF